MDSNLGGKQRGGRPAPFPSPAAYIKWGREGCGTPLRLPPKHPSRTSSPSLTLTLAAPLLPKGAAHHHLHQRLPHPLFPRGCATLLLSLSSYLVW